MKIEKKVLDVPLFYGCESCIQAFSDYQQVTFVVHRFLSTSERDFWRNRNRKTRRNIQYQDERVQVALTNTRWPVRIIEDGSGGYRVYRRFTGVAKEPCA
jgi:hypothetical protein